MESRTTVRFRKAYRSLPGRIQRQARKAYRLFRSDPHHPGLQFKQVHPTQPIYSARVSLGYRALAVVEEDVVIWFWIGSHSEYERLLKTL